MKVGFQTVIITILALQFAIALQDVDYTEHEPWFTDPVPNVTAVAGSDVTLPCKVEALGINYTVAWIRLDKNRLLTVKNFKVTRDSKYSINVSNNRIFSLRIRNVQMDDTGGYLCQINTSPMKDSVGFLKVIDYAGFGESTTLSDHLLQLPIFKDAEPTFYEGPDDHSMGAGYHLRFTCIVESLGGNYTVSWKHFGRNGNLSFGNRTLTSDPRVSISVINNRIFILKIRDIEVADSGRYMCQINTEPVQRRVGFLEVVVLEFINPNRQVEAAIGENVILRCNLKSIPTPKTYWKRDGEEAVIESNSKYDSVVIETGYKVQMRLTIKNVNPDDFGSYMCGADNSWRKAKGNVTLIEKQPWFAEALPNVTVIAGSDVTLDCIVESLNENYAVAWISLERRRPLTLNNRIITSNPWFSITVRSNRIFSLRIQNVQVENSGSFACQLNTDPIKSNVMFLQVIEQSNPNAAIYKPSEDSTVKMSPKIKVSNCRMAVDIGEHITLGCRVKSNPKSMTYWKLDGEGLMSYPNIKYTSNLIDKGDNKIQMKLGIMILSPEDFGTYTCVARNSLGEDEGHIILQNKSEPLSPKCPSREGSKRSAAKSPPKIRIPNRLVAAFVLQDVTLVCNIDSNPEPIVIWTRRGDEILISKNKYDISLIDIGVNKKQMTLTIKNVYPDDFGSYKCIARNTLGDATGKIIMFEKFRHPFGYSSRDELREMHI